MVYLIVIIVVAIVVQLVIGASVGAVQMSMGGVPGMPAVNPY